MKNKNSHIVEQFKNLIEKSYKQKKNSYPNTHIHDP